MRIIILLIFNLMICVITSAQIVDNYGIKIGIGLSNQYWKFKAFSDLSDWNDNKIGFTGQIFAEKCFGKYISFRPVVGYLQKGFIQDMIFRTTEGDEVKENKLVLNDISLDLSIKILPIQTSIKPYLSLGLRVDYLVDHKNIIFDYQGEDLVIDFDLYNDYNNVTLGALVGIGVVFRDFILLELEYNPAITKNYNESGLAINDRYFSMALGASINKIIKRNK